MTKQETYDYLTARGVAYEIAEHPAVYNMDQMAQIALPHPEADAKNLFVRDDKKRNYYLITVRGDRRVDLKAFRKQHRLRNLSFASADELQAILGLIPGAVTPLGLLHDTARDVKFYLDASFGEGLVGVHPNDNTATVFLSAGDLLRLVRERGNETEVAEFD
ncbi:MAG: prolyl-tRNA synthetase associated domain-containing protein [Oscillospiraceae bacterium]|nr:prolyl-tRNA synthetase associated domain-containing protein [Oscillospiraceae bacterium]